MTSMTIAALAERTGIDPLDHLDRDVEIPVYGQPQSQGDVRVRQLATTRVTVHPDAAWVTVPPGGVTVVDGGSGGHAHVLTPCMGATEPLLWTTDVTDPEGLAVGVVQAAEPWFLYHVEHGGMGVAAGEDVIRRQREQADVQRLVAD